MAGVALGAAAARRVGSWADSVITVLALAFYATPIFWVGLMLVLVFSVWLGWLPSFGMDTVGADLHGWAAVADTARYLVLPALTLGLFYMAVYARLTRSAMLDVAGQDFVKTARAKGVPEGRILRRHILRNALLPVVTLAGIQAGQLIGGSVLVETVFAWPGIGRLAFDALLARDYQVLLGVFLTTSVLVRGVQPAHRPALSGDRPADAGGMRPSSRLPATAARRSAGDPAAGRGDGGARPPCCSRSPHGTCRARRSRRRARRASCSAPTAWAATWRRTSPMAPACPCWSAPSPRRWRWRSASCWARWRAMPAAGWTT